MFKTLIGCYYLIVVHTVAAYEYGYHPSSEEFDGPMRVKSWTRDLLWQERNVKRFTPRFNLEKPKDVASGPAFTVHSFVNSASEKNEKFQGYADSDMITLSSENVPAVSKDSFVNKLELPGNHTFMPIFFTNPATGIVYAITEVGVNKNETGLPENGTIPIFVSKEQYDRDLYLLKRSYESKCHRQGRPQIIKLDGGSFVNKLDPVVVKTDLNFATNSTRVTGGKKRKNPRRKAKKHKSSQKKQPVQDLRKNSSFPIEGASVLDTQLEKPNKVNLSSVFSSIRQGKPSPKKIRFNSTQVKRGPHIGHKSPKGKVHVVSKRSIDDAADEKLNVVTPNYSKSSTGSLNSSDNNNLYIVTPAYSTFTTTSLNSTDSDHKQDEVTPSSLGFTTEEQKLNLVTLTRSIKSTEPNAVTAAPFKTTRSLNVSDSEKSKKILSTQIQVTSEYLEPITQTRTPKNSIEAVTHSVVPQKSQSPPCKKAKPKKPPHTHDEYDDYYDFGGTSYNDYPSSDSDSDSDSEAADESSEVSNGVSSLENSIPDYNSLEGTTQQDSNYRLKKTTKKRIKRRRPYTDEYNDYDDDYDDESNDGLMGLFRGLFTPVQWIMDRMFDRAGHMFDETAEPENNDNRKPKYPQYTVYNSGANGVADSETDGYQGNSISSWFGSWFGFRKRRDGVSTTPASLEDEPGWFESWFGYDVRTPSPNEEENDPWFFGWFNSKPRPKRTTTTTTTTPVPILTIAEPLKNPHKWIGILAQHIINSTSTNNPLIEPTTDNPDIPKQVSYNKYQIWRLKPSDDSQVKVLDEYKRGEEGVRMQWLKGPTLRGLTDVLIPPKMLTDFQGMLNFENIAHEILIFDVGKVISYEQAKQDDVPAVKPGPGKPIMSWNRYYDYDSIVKYLELIQVRNPQFVELIHIGRSYEGRPLVIAKIEANKPIDKLTKKKKLKLSKKTDQANGVFIEAGIHGREWIAPASATWMINELLKIMKNNRTTVGTEYIKNTTWYIMPVSNPDSYEFSHQYDRLWKKSRSRHIAKRNGIINSAMTWLQTKKSEKICFGVDLDCNWHYNWGRKGSSKSPCNEFFAGPTPFSEPESKAVSKFLMDNRKQIRLFISLQAYGQIISYPNKLNSSFQSQKLDDLLDVAMVGTDGLRRKGSKSRYKVDSTNDLIESKSGSSDYFATFEVGIPFSYTIHLADNGVHGFLLPSTYIEPTAKDAFEIITAMIDYI